MEDRITELEIKFAHSEKTLDELNDVIIQQGKEIDGLKKQVQFLKDTVDSSPVKAEEDETPPPHY